MNLHPHIGLKRSGVAQHIGMKRSRPIRHIGMKIASHAVSHAVGIENPFANKLEKKIVKTAFEIFK